MINNFAQFVHGENHGEAEGRDPWTRNVRGVDERDRRNHDTPERGGGPARGAGETAKRRGGIAENNRWEEAGQWTGEETNTEWALGRTGTGATFFIEDALKFLILRFEHTNTQQRNVEKLKLIANTELEYITEWEKARYEQNSLRRDMEVEQLEKILNKWRIREKNEQRVHAELTKFLTQETAVSITLFLFN